MRGNSFSELHAVQWTSPLKPCKEVLAGVCIPNSTLTASWGSRNLCPHHTGGSRRCTLPLHKKFPVCEMVFNSAHLWQSDL